MKDRKTLIRVVQRDRFSKWTRFILIVDRIAICNKKLIQSWLDTDKDLEDMKIDLHHYKKEYLRYKAKYLVVERKNAELEKEVKDIREKLSRSGNNRKICAQENRKGTEIYYEIDPEGKKRRVSKEYALKMINLGFYD